jgi:putative sterol carrier protein
LVAHARILSWINSENREQLDATARGSFMSLTLSRTETLMDKIVEN